MKLLRSVVALMVVLAPGVALAGLPAQRAVVPTLGETGLVVLGLGLLGGGLAVLRKRR